MNKTIVYIHGKGGSAEEAEHYKSVCVGYDVIGIEYKAQTPWEAKEEFQLLFGSIYKKTTSIILIANSICAFFAMNALHNRNIEKALFISPIADMEKLIENMMIWSNVTENDLCHKKEIVTPFDETLSWEYLCYVRENPIVWTVPTAILYGTKDNLTSYETITKFAKNIGATLSVMENGEHWFHTDEQMAFLDNWIKSVL